MREGCALPLRFFGKASVDTFPQLFITSAIQTMKSLHFYTTLALGALCLVLSITSIVLGRSNNSLQLQQQQQQAEINKGNTSIQIGQNLLRDMAELPLKNDKVKQVLTRRGLTVSAAPTSTPTPTPSR